MIAATPKSVGQMIATTILLRTPSRAILLRRSYAPTALRPPCLRTIHTTSSLLKKKSKKPEKESERAEDEEDDDEPHTKKGKSKIIKASDMVPKSQSKVSPEGPLRLLFPPLPPSPALTRHPAAKAECDKALSKMTSLIDWFRKESSSLENRALGRVTPAILDNVRVDVEGAQTKVSEVATVGVKEGTVLVVTVFDEHVSLLRG